MIRYDMIRQTFFFFCANRSPPLTNPPPRPSPPDPTFLCLCETSCTHTHTHRSDGWNQMAGSLFPIEGVLIANMQNNLYDDDADKVLYACVRVCVRVCCLLCV